MLRKRALHIPIQTLMKQHLAVTLAVLPAQQVNTCNGRAHKFGSVTPDQNTRPRAAKNRTVTKEAAVCHQYCQRRQELKSPKRNSEPPLPHEQACRSNAHQSEVP